MKHIMLITTGLTGILNASFEVVDRLQKAGYRVTYACPHDVRERVETQGFTYVQLRPVQQQPAPALSPSLSRFQRIYQTVFKAGWRRRMAIERLGMEQFEQLLKDIKPDLLLLDMELHEHIVTAYAAKVPFLLLSQWFSIWESAGLPMPQSRIIPDTDQEAAVQKEWREDYEKRRKKIRRQALKSGYTDRRSILKLYARQKGFPVEEWLPYQWPGPFAYRSLPVLSMTHEALEFPHQYRENLHYIGAMVYEKRKEKAIDPNIEERLKQLFADKQKKNKKLIYCSRTTMDATEEYEFLDKIIQAVSDRKDWILVAGTKQAYKYTATDNIHLFEWLPQLEVLKHADCSVNHGGIHTINECIHFAVPMLVYSGGQHDQNGCAARIAYHQLGIRGDKYKDSVEDIQQYIEAVISNGLFKERVLRVNELASSEKDHLSFIIS